MDEQGYRVRGSHTESEGLLTLRRWEKDQNLRNHRESTARAFSFIASERGGQCGSTGCGAPDAHDGKITEGVREQV
jgi:hypothetical protein